VMVASARAVTATITVGISSVATGAVDADSTAFTI
jgi:hypothetical protein